MNSKEAISAKILTFDYLEDNTRSLLLQYCVFIKKQIFLPVSIFQNGCIEAITGQIWARRHFRANVEHRLGPTKTAGFKKKSAPVPCVLIFPKSHFQSLVLVANLEIISHFVSFCSDRTFRRRKMRIKSLQLTPSNF